MIVRAFAAIVLTLLLSGCGAVDLVKDEAGISTEIAMIDSVVPRDEPKSKTGNNAYTVFGVSYHPMESASGYKERGIASWYGKKFHGRRTSSGERYNMYKLTAAHKTLPLPTYVRVTNLDNRKQVIVKVNDRGPFVGDRIIDLSYAAASHLDMVKQGVGPVEVVALTENTDQAHSRGSAHYLQVGSFRLFSNAKAVETELKGAGFSPVVIDNAVINGQGYYQVRLGPIASSDEVRRSASKLERLLKIKPLVISK